MRVLFVSLALATLLGSSVPAARAQDDLDYTDAHLNRDSLRGERPPPGAMWLESLDLSRMAQRRDRPRAARSIRDLPIRLGGEEYLHGIGTRSISEFVIDLHGEATRFAAVVGLDDAVKSGVGSVVYEVWADDHRVASSGIMRPGDAPKLLSVDLGGAQVLTLLLDDGGDTSNDDEGAWAGACLFLKRGATLAPGPYLPPAEEPPALAAADLSPQPRIHGPRVTGATPGRPFLFRIPASGQTPLNYRATGLPAGLHLDERSGIISGSLPRAGAWRVSIAVRNPSGLAQRQLRIVAGPGSLALTPPMGWNSWNVWGPAVDAEKVAAAAKQLETSGLAAYGYQYLVIDDTWEGSRSAGGEIQANQKFPDMPALAAAVHARGLKLGIYSSPGPRTCEEYAGSWQHEAQDAASYALWGMDFLKYDWCSYDEVAKDHSLAELQKPYVLMRQALDQVDRDIVYSLCQYGYGDVWQWGADVGGNLWRTSGDLLDLWSNLQSVGFRQAGREQRVGPGHWNDTDMLVVGDLGWGPQLHHTRLTPNEQMLHLSLWSLQAAPLFIGADLAQLDDFTRALLTNDEVLDIDQDVLGHAASRIWQDERLEVWSRPLADGTQAVGLFNRGLHPQTVTVHWADLGLEGRQPVRNLWLRRNLGEFADSFAATVPRHGVVFIRIGRPQQPN